MQILTFSELLAATEGTLKNPVYGETEINGITTDSREAKRGMLFVPLKGEKTDGHNYIQSVLDNGAAAVSQINKDYDGNVIMVKDTRKALGDIARYYKNKYKIPVVSVTGSVGKTTTKDLIYSVLSERFKTHKTPNNFNNDIGVPLTVFGIEKEHEAVVIEMGMNHFGEIEYLADIVNPDCAVITNIGMSHIENLGSQAGILKAKMEITKNFDAKNTLFINGDDEYLKTVKSENYKIVRFGIETSNDIYAKDIVNNGLKGLQFTAVHPGGEFRVSIMLPGKHNIYNALSAIAVGFYMGLSEEECAAGIKNCIYTSSRLEIFESGGIEIINDCYNSSPASVRAALEVMSFSLKKRKVAVLGDILEMGGYAKSAHYKLGESVVKYADMLICVGENARYIAEGAKENGMENILLFSETEELKPKIREIIKEGDCVLIKASHGMNFFKLTDELKENQ